MSSGVSRFVNATDGLRLHVRDYGPASSALTPVLCLPGLSRTSDDFERVATVLSDGWALEPRRVVAFDYRGRGLSAWDTDHRNYSLEVESADIRSVLAAIGMTEAIVIGTSRGGLHAMLLASLEPALLRGVVLNDIGPVIAAEGVERIKSYIGKVPPPPSWAAAVDAMRRMAAGRFPGLTAAEWDAYARLTFEEKDGAIGSRYDPALMNGFANFDPTKIPELWPQFDGLRSIPLLIIRGEMSDLLTEQTASEMARRHPEAGLVTVQGQGHAPLLLDDPTIGRIVDFVKHCDRRASAVNLLRSADRAIRRSSPG